MKKVLVSTFPFSQSSEKPLRLLKDAGFEVVTCPAHRKFTFEEYQQELVNTDALIAGTELLNEKLLSAAKDLKIIARIGIGLDNVDFDYAQRKNICVTYTPDGPSQSVAELTLGYILNLARMIHVADQDIRKSNWTRHTGFLIQNKVLGIIGLGRIGKLVAKMAKSLGMIVIAHDIEPDSTFADSLGIALTTKQEILKNSDFVTLHIPLNEQNKNYLSQKEFNTMKNTSYVINTSRGGIVNESSLLAALKFKKIAGAALDVYSKEPYNLDGHEELAALPQVILTAHMGSCTHEGRNLMEIEAVNSVLDYFSKQTPKNIAPVVTL